MHQAMFKLLNLTQATYKDTTARSNYKNIMKVLHPDKNSNPDASRISAAVTRAYRILSDYHKRNHYVQTGKPSRDEPYDEKEAEELAKIMKKLITLHNHEMNMRRQNRQRKANEEQKQNKNSQSNNKQKDTKSNKSKVLTPTKNQDNNRANTNKEPTTPPHIDEANDENSPPTKQSRKRASSQDSKTETITLSSDDDLEVTDTEEVYGKSNKTDHTPEKENTTSYTNAQTEVTPTKTKDTGSSPIKFEPEKTFTDAATSPMRATEENIEQTDDTNSRQPTKRNLNFNESTNESDSSTETPTKQKSDTKLESKAKQRTPSGREYIAEIINYRTRTEGNVKFSIKWGPSQEKDTLPLKEVLEERHALKRWLDKIRVESPNRLRCIMKYHPEFKDVI